MDDLARGWAIVAGQGHGRVGAMVAIMVAVLIAVTMGLWVAKSAARRRDKGASATSLRPKQRAPLPGPDRGFR